MGFKQLWLIVGQLIIVFSFQKTIAQPSSQERLPVMVHILSDCSGRLFLPNDMIVPPRDLEIINKLVKTVVCSKNGYGLEDDSFISNHDKKLSLKLKEEIDFYAAGSRYFPVIKFSTLRTGGSIAILEPPVKNYLRLSYRANFKRERESTIGEHLENLDSTINQSYENEIDYKGLNVLAELEFYISQALMATEYKHVFIVFTDGFVNSSTQQIWPPSKIKKVIHNRELLPSLYNTPSNLNGSHSKLIILETGGYDYNPEIGRTGEIGQNDILKELWKHWAESASLDLVWRTKWDRVLTKNEIEKLVFME